MRTTTEGRFAGVVAEIMASPLITGSPDERFEDLCEHSSLGRLDQIPVIEHGHIVGVCPEPKDQNQRLGDAMIPLRGDMLMSADTPVLDLLSADWEISSFFLVVVGLEIVGMVTPSDLNKVPVYAALFDLIAVYEDNLTTFLDRTPMSDDRLSLFDEDARKKVNNYFTKLQRRGFEISKLRVLSLTQKHRLFQHEQTGLAPGEVTLSSIVNMRDNVAHQKPFISSNTSIHEANIAVSETRKLIALLQETT